MEKEVQGKTWVVLVPLPLQGHVNPMLELGTVLHSKGFSIIVMHTKLNSPDPSNYPDFLFNPLPFNTTSENSVVGSTTRDLFAMVLDLNVNSKAPFKEFLAKMTLDLLKPRDQIGCIIYDNYMYFCEDVAIDLGLPKAMLRTYSAAASLAYLRVPKVSAQGLVPLQETMREKSVEDLYSLMFKDLPLFEHKNIKELLSLFVMGHRETTSPTILNTFDDIEHQSLEKLQQHYQVPFFAIGPLHKIVWSSKTSSLYEEDRSCISWLDKQAPNSVLYVSIGSLNLMDEKGLTEMAWGLTDSDQPFLWVVRQRSEHEWIEILPNNVKEKIREKGHMIKWAPQKEVLAHRAVGGFLSHCGWNSTMESIAEGVPMICYPCFGDQIVNARYLIHEWGVGLELEKETERVKVEIAVRKLLVDEEGKGIKQRVIHLKEKADDSLRKDGSSFDSLEKLVKFIRNDTTKALVRP